MGAAPAAPEEPPTPESDFLRTLGLAGKAVFKGVSSLPLGYADVTDLPKALASKLFDQPYRSPSQRVHEAINARTDSPRTAGERLTEDAIAGTAGALTGGPATALTAASGLAGGVGGGLAREAGGGPVSQVATAILASLVPGGAARVGRTVGNMADAAFIPGGGERAAVRATANIVPNKDAVAEALMKAKPGQTAGQAAAGTGNAEMAALEKIARENAPSAFQKVDDAQQAARAAAVGSIAKTPAELTAAKVARGAQAEADYGAANKIISKPDEELSKLLDRPSMEKALARASDIAKENGDEIVLSSGKNLHYMKMAMDDLIKNPERFGIGATEARAIGDTQRKFVSWIESQNAPYAAARSNFREASKPINQMVAGAELEKALTSGTGKERAGPFTNAVENATRIPELQRKSGAQRFGSLEDVIDPAQMAKVKNVAEEFKTDAKVQELAVAGTQKVNKLYKGELDQISLPQLLSRPAMVANALIRRLEGYGSKRTTDQLSRLMQPENVKRYGELVKRHGKDDARKMIIEAIIAGSKGGIAQQGGQ
jgi:hypothetical protein